MLGLYHVWKNNFLLFYGFGWLQLHQLYTRQLLQLHLHCQHGGKYWYTVYTILMLPHLFKYLIYSKIYAWSHFIQSIFSSTCYTTEANIASCLPIVGQATLTGRKKRDDSMEQNYPNIQPIVELNDIIIDFNEIISPTRVSTFTGSWYTGTEIRDKILTFIIEQYLFLLYF